MNCITAKDKWNPPQWALLERLLFDVMNQAAIEFANRYTRADKTLIWRERWAGMDGSDDPYEGFMNFPLFYALGGGAPVYQLSKEIWEAITWQWTEYGQLHQEFDGYYDWMHHGEGYLYFYFFGLADPAVLKDKQRAVRFANFYTGNNPDIPNYDKEKRLIRSPITGSRGPRFQMTAEDWETHREILNEYLPPFEDIPGVDGNGLTCPWLDDQVYAEILTRFNERKAKGDVPLNLSCTTMMVHAYMYTADNVYRDWVLEYTQAWKERTERNGGITPDNVGLSGDIGEYLEGKWWGGYYGWRWPHGSFTILEPEVIACSNAVLLTGELHRLDLARSQLDMLWDLRKQENGLWLVPNRHYDDGWRDYRIPHPMYAIYLWNISMAEEDAERAERGWPEGRWVRTDPIHNGYDDSNGVHMGFNGNTAQWYKFIRGNDPQYPVEILEMNYQTISAQLERIRSDEFDPLQWDPYEKSMSIHSWQELTPILVEGLAQLTMGGPMHVYHGGLQHTRVRYYDAQAKRPGLPEGVGALVERLTDKSVTLSLVNLDLFNVKEVIIQAGAFGEHCFAEADILDEQDQIMETAAAEGKWLKIILEAGAGIKLCIKMNRYVNQPTYETPWSVDKTSDLLHGRI